MPINPGIPLQVKSLDLSQGVNNFANAYQQSRQNERQDDIDARNKEVQDLKIQQAKTAIEQQGKTQAVKDWGMDLIKVKSLIDAGDTISARHELIKRKAKLVEQQINDPTVNTNDTDELINYIDKNDINSFNNVVNSELAGISKLGYLGASSGVQFGAQETFKDEKGNLYFGTTQRDPKRASVKSVLSPIGDAPETPVGRVSMVSDLGLTAEEDVKQKAAVAAAIKAAQLGQELKLKPSVERAVSQVLAEVKLDAENKTLARSNERAFNLYTTAMTGLVNALDNTVTGPFAGMSPALSSNQQIADGAIAALAPVLKQMFRAAGEGIFTDKDQALLLEMVPTRKDRPDAIASKLQNIDAIVRVKLGAQEAATPGSGQQSIPEGQTATNPKTGEKIIFRGGQWQPQ